MEKSERFFSFENSKAKIENWCAYRDRSVDETKQKLFSYGLSPQQVEKIIVHLTELNFLDDKRFAESFVTGKFRIKNWGKQKIFMHLMQKKIQKDFVQDALNSIDYDEYVSTAQVLVEKKWALLEREKDDWTRKQKVIKYVAGRGFEFNVIQEAFSNIQL
jgi:regulatory protein